jgi:ankyrin repeat protein
MKALRSFYQRKKHLPLLRSAAVMFLCFGTFTFPLFGNEQEDLTAALKKAIPEYGSYSDKMDMNEISRLLDAGADPNGRYSTSSTFLIHAAYRNMVQLVQVLLDHGADPNFSPDQKTTPAVFYGNNEITALFIEHGARFDVIDGSRSPLIFILGSRRSSSRQSALLILEWEKTHSPNFCGNYESRKDYLTAVLASLLSYYGSRRIDDTYILAERLLDAGADPAAPYKKNKSDESFPVAYLAVDRVRGDQFIIPMLIERGAPVDGFNDDGYTALYCAIFAENLELASFLLKKGADINQQNKDGGTALMAASPKGVSGSEAVMRFLLINGADPNLQDKNGETVLMKSDGEKALINVLLENGADPTIKDNKGKTVLHHWNYSLNGPMIDELISRGCLIDEPDNEGFTPLMRAMGYATATHLYPVLSLLEKGADPNYRGLKGRTALHVKLLRIEEYARDYDHNDSWEFLPAITALLEAGTRPADKDDDGDSALITAIRIARKYKNKAPIGRLVQQYANAGEIKIATAEAREKVSVERREKTNETLSFKIEDTFKALCVPVVLGGLSLFMREVAFKDNPSTNIMGPINAVLTLGGGGAVLGFFMGAGMGDGLGALLTAFFGGVLGGAAGIIVACMPSVYTAFTDNPVLYYSPAIISAAIASFAILKIWF